LLVERQTPTRILPSDFSDLIEGSKCLIVQKEEYTDYETTNEFIITIFLQIFLFS